MIRQLKNYGTGPAASEQSIKASHVIDSLISAYQRKSLAAERSEKVCSHQLPRLLINLVFVLMTTPH